MDGGLGSFLMGRLWFERDGTWSNAISRDLIVGCVLSVKSYGLSVKSYGLSFKSYGLRIKSCGKQYVLKCNREWFMQACAVEWGR